MPESQRLAKLGIFLSKGRQLRLGLGELSGLLLGGQRVYPRRLEDQGFTFRFPSLEEALDDLANTAS